MRCKADAVPEPMMREGCDWWLTHQNYCGNSPEGHGACPKVCVLWWTFLGLLNALTPCAILAARCNSSASARTIPNFQSVIWMYRAHCLAPCLVSSSQELAAGRVGTDALCRFSIAHYDPSSRSRQIGKFRQSCAPQRWPTGGCDSGIRAPWVPPARLQHSLTACGRQGGHCGLEIGFEM